MITWSFILNPFHNKTETKYYVLALWWFQICIWSCFIIKSFHSHGFQIKKLRPIYLYNGNVYTGKNIFWYQNWQNDISMVIYRWYIGLDNETKKQQTSTYSMHGTAASSIHQQIEIEYEQIKDNSINTSKCHFYFNGLVQDCGISIANVLEIVQSCTKSWIYRSKCWV